MKDAVALMVIFCCGICWPVERNLLRRTALMIVMAFALAVLVR